MKVNWRRRAIWALGVQRGSGAGAMNLGKKNRDTGGETPELLEKRIEKRCRNGECQKTRGGKDKVQNTGGRKEG
jgi:hypothetical protein